MCGIMVGIQSAMAEIRWGKKKKKVTTGRKFNVRICYSERLLDNSRIRQLAGCQLADWSTHGLDNSWTSQLADWTTCGLDNSWIPTMWTYRIISLIYVWVRTQKRLINGLTTIFNCILLWNTSVWHNDVFYVHIIIYLKLQLLPATSASCLVC